MIVCFPFPKKKFTTLISVYAPTMTKPDVVKDGFYEDLENAVPGLDKLILPGDLNARVSREHLL